MSEKRRRVELSIKEKLEIIAVCDGPPKQSFAAVAEKFNIDRSTVSKIYKKRRILAEVASSSNMSRKRQRSSKVEHVDEALHQWFVSAIATDLPISGEILRTKAKEFAYDLGFENFLASNGWLDRWKKRYGVVYKKANGENVPAADQWLSTTLSDVLQRYKPDDIYTAHETAFYWRAFPNGSRIFKEGKPSGGKIAKDRITVLVCASMTGDKRPLLVVGKSKTPPSFRNVKTPPVSYSHNENAWMTSAIFEDWLCAWDKELALGRRKVALVVANCAAHAMLGCIELVFLPPNLTPLVQPCELGIIRTLKEHYRRLIVFRLLAVIESSDEDISALELTRKIDLLCSIRLLKEAWDLVTGETVINSFWKAKFYRESTNVSLLHKHTFTKDEIDFDVDHDLKCGQRLNEKTIGRDIVGMEADREMSGVTAGINEEEPDAEMPQVVATKAMALEALQLLETFLSRGGVQDWRHFNQLESQVQQIILKNRTKTHELTLEKWLQQK